MTPNLVRSAAMFRGEDATGVDVLYEPLMRARLADATRICECKSSTSVRLKLLFTSELCFVRAGGLRAEVFAVVGGDIFCTVL
jgi:hypothetical protein